MLVLWGVGVLGCCFLPCWCFGVTVCALPTFAGCPLLTTTGLSGLVQLQELEELELTNCPGATPELFKYFSQHLPCCMVIE
ncbi:f-box lrr-repeat protein 16 [Limosa lapponica baueri]|uniref:F-box lrr-repeat protein 16 n=1 Tax=Limosa lapponica baueri TaxID=1758121 RepID=A0A2I0T1C2_LIMLA|nr:f-box lrr-repeat protein 16 [Limosa lapponica baueri]